MITAERERINTLIDIALHMAQELQEYVDVAIECSGSNSAELAAQELLKDWEAAYKAFEAAELSEDRSDLWRYPPDMPPHGQRVLMTYRGHDGVESSPIASTWSKEAWRYCHPLVRWMEIPEVE